MRYNTLEATLPQAQKCVAHGGKLFCCDLGNIAASGKALTAAQTLQKAFDLLGQRKEICDNGNIKFIEQAMPDEAYKINVSETGVEIVSASSRGFLYAANAFIQMLVCAMREGGRKSYLDTGSVEDFPRFAWRGFMLDSARHFQSPELIREFLMLLAVFRINVFHWHLTDNQSWRISVKALDGIAGSGSLTDGSFSAEDIAGINDLAAKLCITVIPEIDVPGHSERLLKKFPQYACDPTAEKNRELCLGNPEIRELLKNIFDGLLELFPDSPYIHIGGDEAALEHWQKCPKCLQAVKEKNFRNMRELENDLMREVAAHIRRRGRTPIIWSGGAASEQRYDSDVMVQTWLDIREPIKFCAAGNKVIYSVHNSLYFDYPANQHEPQENWMFELSERGIYMTDPYMIWPEKVQDHLVGTEACLWTETVPQWRVMEKVLPRLPAYSEAAWSNSETRNFDDFLRRKNYLAAAGYFDVIKRLIAH